MNAENTKWVWKGYEWRFITLLVLAIAVLQVVLKFTLKFDMYVSMPLAVMMAAYVVIPRAKQRKLANAIVSVVAMYLVDLILVPSMEWSTFTSQMHSVGNVIYTLAFPIVLGIAVAYFYERLNRWSDKKRAEQEAKRRERMSAKAPDSVPSKRVHRKKKRKR